MRMLTQKASAIMRVCFVNNIDGSYKDIDQILIEIDYKTTKDSIQFSLRALVNRGLLTKGNSLEVRRGKGRVIYTPTAEAYSLLRSL